MGWAEVGLGLGWDGQWELRGGATQGGGTGSSSIGGSSTREGRGQRSCGAARLTTAIEAQRDLHLVSK